MAEDEGVLKFPTRGPGWSDTDTNKVAADLSAALGMPVQMVSSGGDHVVTIRANGLENLDRLAWILQHGATAWNDEA